VSIMAACTLRVAFQSSLLLAICLAHNHHVASQATSVFMSEEDAEEEMQKVEQLDEQAEMLVVHTNQTISDFSDVVNEKVTVDELKKKYAIREQALAALGSSLDPATAPCDDFYRYSCGGWLNSTEIPSDSSKWSKTFSTIHRNNLHILRGVLNGSQDDQFPATKLPEDMVNKVRMFYESCNNMTLRESEGFKKLTPILDLITATTTHTEVAKLMGQLEVDGLSVTPFGFGVGADDKHPVWNVGFGGQGGLGLPDISYYSSDDTRIIAVRAAYSLLIDNLFSLVGHTGSAADVIDFETRLANISLSREQRRDPLALYNPTTMGQFKTNYTEFAPFMDAFSTTFSSFGDDARIVLESPNYFSNVSAMFTDDADAGVSVETLQSYMLLRVVIELAPYMGAQAGDLVFGFYGQMLHGIQVRPALWKRCVAITQEYLWEISDQIYLERVFSGASEPIANMLLDYVKGAFSKLLEVNKWMDSTTKAAARMKLGAMGRKIGAPLKWKSYDGMDVNGLFLENVIEANKFSAADGFRKMGQKVDRLKWGMHASEVNAYYSPNMNEMAFPAGILQPPFFSKDAPMVLNFASIGAVMGHELTHGFDDQGAQFDAHGGLNNWWSRASTTRFSKKTRCFVEQYEGFVLPGVDPGIKVNGKLTLGENLADNGGVVLALHAYKKWAVENGAPTLFKLHGKSYSDMHLFWTAYAQTWCAKQTPEGLAQQVLTDPHSPGRLRVLGPLQNTADFNDEFECAEDSVMNPKRKCYLWTEYKKPQPSFMDELAEDLM